MLKKKFYEWLALVLIYFCIVLVIYAASASAAVSFQYSDTVAIEYDFNQFVANITSNSSYTPLQIQSAILLSGEKSPNIRMTNIVKIPSGYLVYGSLVDYSIPNNKLFNPWFNGSWEKRKIFNLTGLDGDTVNITNEPFNNSDRWFNYTDSLPLNFTPYNRLGGQTDIMIKPNMLGNTQWAKYVNLSNSYPSVANETRTYPFWDNIANTSQFNQTKWYQINPVTATIQVQNDYLNLSCIGTCGQYFDEGMFGNVNLSTFSTLIFVWDASDGGLSLGGFEQIPLVNGFYYLRTAWTRKDGTFLTGDNSISSTNVFPVPSAKVKIEIDKTPWYNKAFLNDTLINNKSNNIWNGGGSAFFTTNTAAGNGKSRLYSVIGYNRSNATYTVFQESIYQPLNFISWSNNRTNDASLSNTTTYPNTIKFNATTSLNCDNCSWYVNGLPFANQTLLNQTNLTYSFVSAGTYYINLTARNDTFSNTASLSWIVIAFNPIAIANLDGFVNNTPLGAYVNGVRVDLISTTGGSNFTTWSQNHLLGNTTNMAPTIEPSSPGTGERVINVTYWANNSDIEILAFAHAMNVGETAGVFVYLDDVLVAPQSGRPLAGAETSFREITVTVPRYSSYRINFTNYHHYEWRESPQVSGYYKFVNVPTGNYSLLFQQVAYNNLTAPISLTANTRYNATISPTLIIEDDDSDIESLSVFAFVLGMFLLILIIRYRKKVDKYLFDKRII